LQNQITLCKCIRALKNGRRLFWALEVVTSHRFDPVSDGWAVVGEGVADSREIKEANSSRGPANIVPGKWSVFAAEGK